MSFPTNRFQITIDVESNLPLDEWDAEHTLDWFCTAVVRSAKPAVLQALKVVKKAPRCPSTLAVLGKGDPILKFQCVNDELHEGSHSSEIMREFEQYVWL